MLALEDEEPATMVNYYESAHGSSQIVDSQVLVFDENFSPGYTSHTTPNTPVTDISTNYTEEPQVFILDEQMNMISTPSMGSKRFSISVSLFYLFLIH